MRHPGLKIMHRARIGLRGMPVGELWNFDPLATACAARRAVVFPVIMAPLSVAGGVGSLRSSITGSGLDGPGGLGIIAG